MRVLIVGAGAVGGYFGAKLAAAGNEVVFTARGEHLAALRRAGLVVEQASGELRLAFVDAVDSARGRGPFDLLLVCVKAHHTVAALDGVAAELADGAIVLSLQNGIESEATIERLLGMRSLLSGTAYVGVELVAPGVIRHTSGGTIVAGEIDGRPSERLERLERMLAAASIELLVPPDVRRAKWQKLAWNAAFNLVCALSGATIGGVLDDPEARAVAAAVMSEVEAVAGAAGVTFETAYVPRILRKAERLHRAVRPSTLQDREKRKPLEHEALTGVVVRLGKLHGVATPFTETLDRLARLVSERPAA